MARLYVFLQRHMAACCFIAVLLLAMALRLSHLDIAHFQLDQSRSAQRVWEIAREGQFPSHDFPLSGGYYHFPLPLYIWAPAFFVAPSVHAILIWNILINVVALPMCWYFARRYWNWKVAALATLLFATSPWHAFFAHRVWSNIQMSPLVMIWLIGATFAYHEKRPRFWALTFAMATLLTQLHPSGVIFFLISGLLCLITSRNLLSWGWATVGILLAMIPALPWIGAHLSDEIYIFTERLPFFGEDKRALVYNYRPLIDFLTAHDWRLWFNGAYLAKLARVFSPLEVLALPVLLAFALSGIFACWQSRSRGGQRRRVFRVLCLWLCLPILFFPFVSYESHALVYYIPLLPAPFLLLAAGWNSLHRRWRLPGLIVILLLSLLQAYAVWGSAQFIRGAVATDDDTVWAVGGGAPLNVQLKIALQAREAIEYGEADEIVLLIDPVLTLEYEHFAYALPLLTGMPIRHLDQSKSHLLYPAESSVWVLDRHNTTMPLAYAGAVERARSGRFSLYWLPGKGGPAPAIPLPNRPEYANGVQLLGYDALSCADGWWLHWTPGPTSDDDETRTHFFVALLGIDANPIAQNDFGAYDARLWRPGDHIVTRFDFGSLSPEAHIETIRVGLYSFSVAAQAFSESIYALDEAGNPWLYAVDLPFASRCAADGMSP